MPVKRIPLVGSLDTRNADSFTSLITNDKDQQFKGCYINVVNNPISRQGRAYVVKRPGLNAELTVLADRYIFYLSAPFDGTNYLSVLTNASGVSWAAYKGTTSVLTLSGCPSAVAELRFAGTDYVFITGSSIFYTNAAAFGGSTTFTADTASGSAVLSNVSSTTGLLVGQTVTGTGIQSSTEILSIDSATQVTMNKTATANGSGVTITRSVFGNINSVDADAPTDANGDVVEMDGFLFVGTSGGKIYNSNINSITSWSANGYITPGIYGGACRTLKKIKNKIAYLGENGIEMFYNAGHATGSPLGRSEEAAINLGVDESSTIAANAVPCVGSGEDLIVFKSGSKTSRGSCIYTLSSSGIQKISTREVDSIISYIGDSSGSSKVCVIDVFRMDGHRFIHVGVTKDAVSSPTEGENVSLLYSEHSGMWTQTGLSAIYRFTDVGKDLTNQGLVLAGAVTGTSGKVFSINKSNAAPVYQDDGSAFTMTIQTTKLDLGTNVRKTVSRVDLIGSDIQSTGTATLETCDDDYATWVTRGTFDMTDINPRVLRCGSHKGGRAYRITHSANTAFRASAIDIHYEIEEEAT